MVQNPLKKAALRFLLSITLSFLLWQLKVLFQILTFILSVLLQDSYKPGQMEW